MTLIEDVKKLVEMEKHATPGPWRIQEEHSEDEHITYNTRTLMVGETEIDIYADLYLVAHLRNAAPQMLQVLGTFQEGDCKRLISLRNFLREYCTNIRPQEKESLDMLSRLAKAARILEADLKQSEIVIQAKMEVIDAQAEEIERHKRSIDASLRFTKDCMEELASKRKHIEELEVENKELREAYHERITELGRCIDEIAAKDAEIQQIKGNLALCEGAKIDRDAEKQLVQEYPWLPFLCFAIEEIEAKLENISPLKCNCSRCTGLPEQEYPEDTEYSRT